MYAKFLKCTSCDKEYPLEPLYECSVCEGILKVVYNYDDSIVNELIESKSVKHYSDLLPINHGSAISIGEGNTPLIRAKRLGFRLGIKELFLKCEYCNPTGSFKDRPVSIGISKAVEFGFSKVVVASSGNGASAVAALAAKAGLKALIFVPESTPTEKVKQAAFYGAKVFKVNGPYSNSYQLAKQVSFQTREVFNLTTTFINPYTVEGDKLIAYELYKQMGGIVPNAIFVPIGAGPLLVGIYKGYEELKMMGIISDLPRMVGVQAEGCSPIAKAFLAGEQHVKSDDHPKTIAGAICDGLVGYSKDGDFTLEIIRKSNGFAMMCDDQSILQAQRWLAIDEGSFVEPASATSIVAIEKSIGENKINENQIVVCLLTGHGLKDVGNLDLNIEIPTLKENETQILNLF